MNVNQLNLRIFDVCKLNMKCMHICILGLSLFIQGCNLWSSSGRKKSIVVQVHSPGGRSEPTGLAGRAQLVINYGNETLLAVINENGIADFGDIPPELFGKRVKIEVRKMGWVKTYPDSMYLINGDTLYLPVQRDFLLQGKVIDIKTFDPIEGVKVEFLNRDTLTNAKGIFKFMIPDTLNSDTFSLTFSAEGYEDKSLEVRPIFGVLDIRLNPRIEDR